MAAEYAVFKTGPLTMPPSQLGAFARSDETQPTPNIEWHVQPLSLDKFGDPLHTFSGDHAERVQSASALARMGSHRRRPIPRRTRRSSSITCSEPEDRRVAVDAMRFTRRIMAANALARFTPDEFRPGTDAQTDDELAQAAGELGTTIFHPVGTCKMGSDPLAVVDDRLRVRGIDRLRVIDASIMPRITSGNTKRLST